MSFKTTMKVMNLKSNKAWQEVSDKAVALLKTTHVQNCVLTLHSALFENQFTVRFHVCTQHSESGILRIRVSHKTSQVYLQMASFKSYFTNFTVAEKGQYSDGYFKCTVLKPSFVFIVRYTSSHCWSIFIAILCVL